MNELNGIERLSLLTDADCDPVLTVADLAQVLAASVRTDAAGNTSKNVDTAPTWAAGYVYAVGDVVTADPAVGRWWICTTPGRSNVTQPVWPAASRSRPGDLMVVEDEVVWTFAGTKWTPTWDMNAAAALAWQVKSGRASSRFNFTADGQNFQRAQLFDHCRQMERSFRRRVSSGV